VGAGYRVITYDRRGFGQSSQPWQGYDYDTLAADLAALVDHLDLQNMVLIGFSMGGGEVLRYVRHFGHDRVSKIVLASAVPPYLYKSEDNPDGGLDDATIDEFLSAVASDRLAFLDGFLTGFFSSGRKLMVSPQQKDYAYDPRGGGVAQGHGRLHHRLGADGLSGGCGRSRRAHVGHPRRLRRHRAVRGQR
jgi:pimeloyl-ACP methyl ester carboxylesterase